MSPGVETADEILAVQAREGDLSAFDELVRRHHGRIWRFHHVMTRDPHWAADLTQETFLTAFRRLEQYDPARPWLPWLLAIARHKCTDHWRRRGPETLQLEPSLSAPGSDPRQATADRETWHDLWDWAHRHLPLLQVQALWLRYHEDLPVRTIARILGKAETHVKVLLFRARRTLAREWWPQHAGVVEAEVGPATFSELASSGESPAEPRCSCQPRMFP